MGLALIEAVTDNYSKIIAHYRSSQDRFSHLKNKLGDKLVLVQADFADSESVRSMLDEIKSMGLQPDHIVHLAASPMENQKFKKLGWQDFSVAIDTDLRPIVDILGDFLPAMTKAKYGKVIFMLTSCVVGMPPKYKSVYTTAKYALLGLAKSLAVEYADKGITVNAVSPEMIDTRFVDNLPDLVKEMNAADMPLKRNLKVEDVIPTFAYLLSDGGDMVSGQNIVISDSKC